MNSSFLVQDSPEDSLLDVSNNTLKIESNVFQFFSKPEMYAKLKKLKIPSVRTEGLKNIAGRG